MLRKQRKYLKTQIVNILTIRCKAPQQFLMWHFLIKFEILRAEKPIFLG
jgi:hypothetical protein